MVMLLEASYQPLDWVIGEAAGTYTLYLKPSISITFLSTNHTRSDTFSPVLSFSPQTSIPAVYNMEGFSHSSQKTIDHNEVVYHTGNPSGVLVSQIISAVAFVGLVITLFMVWKYWKKSSPSLNLRRGILGKKSAIEDAKEIKRSEKLIAEMANKPEDDKGKTIVKMRSFKDLAKVSDDLFKPILSEELAQIMPDGRKQKKFYVLDGMTIYEYVEQAGE